MNMSEFKKHEMIAKVSKNGWYLCEAQASLKNDKDVVLAAVRQYGTALQYASDDLKKDRHIVLTAFQQNYRSYIHAHEDLIPFFVALINVKNELTQISDVGYKVKIHQLIAHCELCFLNQESVDVLTTILEKTKDLLAQNINANEYKNYAKDILKHPSKAVMLLGKLMKAISMIVMAVSSAAAFTGMALPALTGFSISGILFFSSDHLIKPGINDGVLIEKMNTL